MPNKFMNHAYFLLFVPCCLLPLAKPARGAGLPSITSFTPASVTVGTSVTLQGLNLSDVTKVYFHGIPGTIVSKTATSLVANAPAGIDNGNIVVLNPSGYGFSATNFTYTGAYPKPILSAFSPLKARVGDFVTVTGTGFQGSIALRVGQIQAIVATRTKTSLKFVVPPGATTNPVTILLPGGTVTSTASLTIDTTAAPVVSCATSPLLGRWKPIAVTCKAGVPQRNFQAELSAILTASYSLTATQFQSGKPAKVGPTSSCRITANHAASCPSSGILSLIAQNSTLTFSGDPNLSLLEGAFVPSVACQGTMTHPAGMRGAMEFVVVSSAAPQKVALLEADVARNEMACGLDGRLMITLQKY